VNPESEQPRRLTIPESQILSLAKQFLGGQLGVIAASRKLSPLRHEVKDHNWDDNENHAWGQFLTENHRESHEYAKSNKKEQSEYWNYRHSHPDKN
jgi:hypothetical protein